MIPKTRIYIIAALVLVAFIAAGCSSGAKERASASGSPAPSASSTVETGTTRFPLRTEKAEVDVAAPAVGGRLSQCPGLSFKFPRTIDPTKSFVIALVDPYRGFGEQCPTLKNGKTCTVPFQGSWRLEESPVGSVVIQIFEDDLPEPVKSVEFGPIGSRGNFGRLMKVQYPVGKVAIKATFRAILKDAGGNVVAVGPPETVPIPSCLG